jgi:hypothetical protein
MGRRRAHSVQAASRTTFENAVLTTTLAVDKPALVAADLPGTCHAPLPHFARVERPLA